MSARSASLLLQQRLYLTYLPLVRMQFGHLPGVAVIGLGAKERGGQLTAEWAFRFYVHQKRPAATIPEGELIPAHLFGIQTDVIPHFETESLVCAESVLSVDSASYRDAGIRGGIAIRNDHFDNDQPSGYGTLGILARRKTDNALVGLTCAHVVNAASQDLTAINTKIGQPKYWITCCCCPHGYIGDVAKATFNADLDCAIIAIHDDIAEKVAAHTTENKIEGLATPVTGAAAMVCFDTVSKRGRATGLTTGKVSDIAYGTHQMLIERTGGAAEAPFACQGDSGAVVVNSSGQVVGLVVAAARDNMKRTIVTHIKPVMLELGITIAATDAATIGEPLGGGPAGCELFLWPGGQADTAMNPVEEFTSTDFGFSGPVSWEVSKGAGGAVIIQTGSQQATGLEAISVRYDTTSPSKNPTDTVQVQAISGDTRTKFRTVFTFTPRAVNTSAPLDPNNSKTFAATAGTTNLAGAAVPVDAGDWFMAKAEIIFDVSPQNISWSGGGAIAFVTGAPAGLKGNIIARRETKFTKGEQVNGTPNRVHQDQAAFASAGDSTADDFQAPTDALPDTLFRLANEGFDPANLLQAYLRADYRDYLEFNTGNGWTRITGYAEWFANLTGALNAAPPPAAGAPNALGTGANPEKVPNQKPTVAAVESFREIKPTEKLTLSVTATDADNDVVTISWAQTAGPATVLSSTTGNEVDFTAPAGDFQFKFTATAKDSTETLSRTAGNFLSDAAEITVNVVEWLYRAGGYAVPADNETELFNAADFGPGAGPLNWDLTTGGTTAVIIQADGVAMAASGTVNGATTILVRYDNASADTTRAQTVKIQATNTASGIIWFKRRTVLAAEWAAWPGAQANTVLNPTETITAADMGFPAGTLLNWQLGHGGVNPVIVGGGGVTANGVTSIILRYDTQSPDATMAGVVRIEAANPATGVNALKLRTIFTVTPLAGNTSANLHGLGGAGGAAGRNDLRFPATDGTTTQAGVVNATMAGVTRIAVKMEQVFTILPLTIPWSRRLASFVFDDALAAVPSLPQMTNSKFECRARRNRRSVFMHQQTGAANRIYTIINQDGTAGNDAAMVNDGFADRGDAQYPTDAMPNHIFRIDAPGIGPAALLRQVSIRSNFEEYIAWHNGTPGAAGWIRITPFSNWFINLSMALPTAANPAPNMIPPNNAGTGHGAVNLSNATPVVNAGADQTVAGAVAVTLTATFTDADNDSISGTFTWTQTGGPSVIAGGVFVGNPLVFPAPAVAGTLTFTVHMDDNVVNALSYNPGNSRGIDTVTVNSTGI